jgi:membrane-associated phospholipid phosphatase
MNLRKFGGVRPWLILSVVCAVLFVLLAVAVSQYKVLSWDTGIMWWVHSWANPVFDEFFVTLTHIGDSIVVVAASVLLGAYLFYKRRRRDACTVLGLVGSAIFVNIIFKEFFDRARPELWQHLVQETGFSFPSGHVMLSTSLLAAIVIVLWDKPYRWVAFCVAVVLAVIVGLSRMYIGVHYPSDVLAGWCVVLVMVGGVMAARAKWYDRHIWPLKKLF